MPLQTLWWWWYDDDDIMMMMMNDKVLLLASFWMKLILHPPKPGDVEGTTVDGTNLSVWAMSLSVTKNTCWRQLIVQISSIQYVSTMWHQIICTSLCCCTYTIRCTLSVNCLIVVPWNITETHVKRYSLHKISIWLVLTNWAVTFKMHTLNSAVTIVPEISKNWS